MLNRSIPAGEVQKLGLPSVIQQGKECRQDAVTSVRRCDRSSKRIFLRPQSGKQVFQHHSNEELLLVQILSLYPLHNLLAKMDLLDSRVVKGRYYPNGFRLQPVLH
jgi:hypothetical protein